MWARKGDVLLRCNGFSRAIAVVLLVGFVVSACDLGDDDGSSRTQPSTPVTIRGSDTPPPSSPPWTLADLVNHQCAVFDEADLARFEMVSPGVVGDGSEFCRWQSLPTAPTTAVMYFLPDIRRQYQDLEAAYRDEPNFRTLTVAGRVSVPSGGTIQFEYALKNAGVVDENCATAVDIATVLAERVH
ncbi:MAG: hypothetical protein DI630_24620 [Gordonia sp. (in: high G+C Gram-positive bacteria)]|nr:MAG: hypothetical protein DI630_24620 [Gordonia sp. (in: high G+C Gram-positive bacteria)]